MISEDYDIGFSNFLWCKIDLSHRPLIPRPETEFWTEQVIKEIGNKKVRVLDIFAGSGCIGIAVLKHCPNAVVNFVDTSDKFLKQIKINTKLNDIKASRYKIIKSNIFSKIYGKYDFILANPPYVDPKRPFPKNEPRQAIVAKDKGLFFIKKFLKEAPKHLNTEGKIYMEFGYGQMGKIKKIIPATFYRDQYGRWRYLVVKLSH